MARSSCLALAVALALYALLFGMDRHERRLALAFLVGVLAPAWYFAGRLVENNTAVRAIGELQRELELLAAAA